MHRRQNTSGRVESRRPLMSNSQLFRSDITYTHQDLDVCHEAWLISWGFDWFEHGTRELNISRSDQEDECRVEITVTTCENLEELGDWYVGLIMDLAMEVDCFGLEHHRIQ